MVTGISTVLIIILNTVFYDDIILAIGVEAFLFIVHLITYALCFIATIKKNKVMLIPFLIISVIHICFYIILGVYVISMGSSGMKRMLKLTDNNIFIRLGILTFALLLPIIIAIAMSLHSFTIAARYYRQIDIESEDDGLPTINFESCKSANKVIPDGFVGGEAGITINIISPSPSILSSNNSQNNQ